MKIRDDEELTEEEEKAELLTYEGNILDGLLKAAEYTQETYNIEVVRKNNGNRVKLFSFRIHPLSEDVYMDCQKKATRYKRNKRLGTQVAEEMDRDQFRSTLIYAATVPEDQEKVWNRADVKRALDCIRPDEVISRVLMAGEKSAICEKIDEISGYNLTQDDMVSKEEQLKN